MLYIIIRILLFCGDFNLAVWQCGLATANNNIGPIETALNKTIWSSEEVRIA